MGPRLLFDGKAADYDNLSIDFEFENPIWSENHFNTEYTYEFDLPFTATNKKIFGYKDRFDVLKQSDYDFQCVLPAGIFMEGIAKAQVSGGNRISISVISRGIDFVKRIIDQDLKDIPMDEYEIYADDATIVEKLDAWRDHMFDCNFTQSPTEGSHKFPMIWTKGYGGDYSDTNLPHSANSHVVNAIAEGIIMGNWGVLDEDKPKPDDKWWPFTVAPCPRVSYLLSQVFSFYGMSRVRGDLWSNPELQQMVTFSGVVLDEEAVGVTFGSPYKINVHGQSFDLSDFVPDVKVLDLFALLNEVYGAFFVVTKSTITVRTYKEILSRKPVDVSKFCLDAQSYEIQENQLPHIFYEDYEENAIRKGFMPTWDYVGSDFQLDDSGRPVNDNLGEINKEFVLKHYPMKSTFFVTEGFDQNRAQFLSSDALTRQGYGELMPRFTFPYGIMTFGDSKSDYRQERLQVGYYRGVYSTRRFNPATELVDTFDTTWPYSWCRTTWDTRNTTEPFNYLFGSALYLSEEKGTYEEWLQLFFTLGANVDVIRRRMNAPDHVLMRWIQFEDIKHILRDRRGSIAGFLSKVSGKITATGIRDVECEYKVPKVVLSGSDFSNDFSSDYH